jgi:hypothetical protein
VKGTGVMEKLVKTVPIAGGNLLEVLDSSRNITKDIWQLNILFRAEIRIKEEMFTGEDLQKFSVAEIMEALGHSVFFEVGRERKFIHEKDRDRALESLVDDFLNNNGDYLQDADFPKKFIIRKFLESQKAGVSWTR